MSSKFFLHQGKNKKAEQGRPWIYIDEINEYNIGELLYFFEKACGMSAYMLGVNPFNQPGVEDYKREMFRLLGK